VAGENLIGRIPKMQDRKSTSTKTPRSIPEIRYPEELPIAERREEIARTINDHQVVIIAGETGSGKTTQLPKICLELGRGLEKIIGHTQPRRLAARTVAQRIAQELGTELGSLVGYQVRFTDVHSDATAIKLMTDGILLAEMQRDRLLRKYDTIILDEAHERSLNIDFLLGYLKTILPQRPDLKLIITSATIDVEGFSKHFDDAPIIEVSGRAYPVETIYLGQDELDEEGMQSHIVSAVADIDAGQYGKRGDILIFLSGERDIRELAKALRHLSDQSTQLQVLPLYARLSQAEQRRVFETSSSGAGLRVVLATNVAETSLTVPGIRYVIDPGEARISRYSHRTKLQRLPIEPISRASADQRRGRCGRIGPGVCLRLYSETNYDARPEFTDPEIQRTNLAAVVLQMLTLGLGDVEQFPFLNPPDPRMVRDGYKLLEELGAVQSSGKLTNVGRSISRLPVDPRLGRMVLEAKKLDCLAEILVVCSALAVQDPRERPSDKQQQADQMHARFRHESSDLMAWLNLWRYYEEQRQLLSQNQLRKLCKREFLSFMKMREWRDVHTQLSIACRQQKIKTPNTLPDNENYQGVHKALLAGLLSNLAQLQEGKEYLGSRNRKMSIFPGSSQARKPPKWIVSAEIVETSKVFAREVAAVEPRWALDINPGLLKRHYYEPRWQSRRGQVVAYERLSLYGLTLSDKQTVHYGPIAPAESRELLIREGLIPGNYRQFPAFLKHNRNLVRDLQELESRTRRRDILVEEHTLFEFYDQRLPEDMYTADSLQSYLKKTPEAQDTLRMDRELLLANDPGGGVADQFPDKLIHEDVQFRLSYQFEPGQLGDGVSVTIPVGLLNRAPRHRFGWLVPGLLREKCIQLVKGLPKEKRKHMVPVPDFVGRALDEMEVSDSELLDQLARKLTTLSGIVLSRDDWNESKLDDYYRMNIRVVDEKGALLEQGRDLHALVNQFRSDTRQSLDGGKQDSPARDNITRWDFEDLPQQWRFRQAGIDIVSHPALTDQGTSVAIELCDYPKEAQVQHRLGVLKLVRLGSAQQVKYLRKQLLRGNAFSLVLAASGIQREALLEDLINAAYVQAMKLDDELPYGEAAFNTMLERGRTEVITLATGTESTLFNTLEVLGEVRQLMGAFKTGQWVDTHKDVQQQLQYLFPEHLLRDSPAEVIAQYPRYLKALRTRIERLGGQYPKDQKYTALLQTLVEPLVDIQSKHLNILQLCPMAREYRWLLEEFRVSLFAQNLGTKQAVSEKRLRGKWLSVGEWVQHNPY
jgi:ATP-dependent helicase HrpA